MIKQQITEVVVTKLAIYPKDIGLTEDSFDCDGKVKSVRIFSSNEFMTAEYIEIGNKRFNFIPDTSPPSKIKDFICDYEFKKGYVFILSTNIKIECIELFI